MTIRCDTVTDSKPFNLDLVSLRQLEQWIESRDLFIAQLQDHLKELTRPSELYLREEGCVIVCPPPYAAIHLGDVRFVDETGRDRQSVAYLQVYSDDMVLDIYQGYRAAVAVFGPRYNPEDVGL